MSEKVTSRQRVLCAALALLGAAALPLHAAAQEAVESNNAMTVVRDAESGKLRNATAQEQQALQASKARTLLRVAPAPTLQKYHPTGARGTRLTDEFMSSAVAVRNANGGLDMQCLEPHQAADGAVQGAHTHAINNPVTE